MTNEPETPPTISWPRAILTVVVIVVVGVAVLVYGSNAALTKVHNVKRSAMVGIVTPLFFLVLFAMAWVLRRLQRRKLV